MALTQRPKMRTHRKPPSYGPRRRGAPTPVRVETPLPTEFGGILQPAGSTAEAGGRLEGGEGVSGPRLLASDARVAFLLLNQARLRVAARLFGVGPEQANVVTAVALLTLAEAFRRKVHGLTESRLLPGPRDGLLEAAVLRELVSGVAGVSTRDDPQTATLLTLAVVSGLAGPTLVRSIRNVKSGSHRMAVGFHHRYGYLFDPGHWRQRHAQRSSPALRVRPQRIP